MYKNKKFTIKPLEQIKKEIDFFRIYVKKAERIFLECFFQFGKNENYIRTRLKFVSLIPEIAQLLEQDEITILSLIHISDRRQPL